MHCLHFTDLSTYATDATYAKNSDTLEYVRILRKKEYVSVLELGYACVELYVRVVIERYVHVSKNCRSVLSD